MNLKWRKLNNSIMEKLNQSYNMEKEDVKNREHHQEISKIYREILCEMKEVEDTYFNSF